MKPFIFSFKREPVWILILSLAPAAFGLLILLFVVMLRKVSG